MLGPAVYSTEEAIGIWSCSLSAASSVLDLGFILCLKEMMLLCWDSYDLKKKNLLKGKSIKVTGNPWNVATWQVQDKSLSLAKKEKKSLWFTGTGRWLGATHLPFSSLQSQGLGLDLLIPGVYRICPPILPSFPIRAAGTLNKVWFSEVRSRETPGKTFKEKMETTGLILRF